MGNKDSKLEISKEEQASLEAESHYQDKELKRMWGEYKKGAKGDIKSPAELMEALEHLHVVEAIAVHLTPNMKGTKGVASADELRREMLHEPGFRQFLSDTLFGCFDEDKNGHISFKEFVIGVSHLTTGDVKTVAEHQFRALDKDGSGWLDQEEMKQMGNGLIIGLKSGFTIAMHLMRNEIKKSGVKEEDWRLLLNALLKNLDTPEVKGILTKAFFEAADANQDGKITLDEYLKFRTDPAKQAAYQQAVGAAMAPVMAQLQKDIVVAVQQLLTKIQTRR